MNFEYVVAVLVPVAYVELAAAEAARLSGNLDDASSDFFSRRVVDDQDTETHKLAVVSVTGDVMNELPALTQAFPGSDWALYMLVGHRTPLLDLTDWLFQKGLQLPE